MLLNSNQPPSHWCYGAEAAADIYTCIYHSAIKMSPHEAWYGERPSAKEMYVWGCCVLFADHNLKKSQDRACEGFYYGFALMMQWITTSMLRPLDSLNWIQLPIPPLVANSCSGTLMME
jgi:hypothetical protein